jgi:MraZ protein
MGGDLSVGENFGMSDIFISRYLPSLDAKRRLSLPAAYRDVIEARSGSRNQVLIAEHPEHPALRVYDPRYGQSLYQAMQTKFGDELSSEQELWAIGSISALTDYTLDSGGRLGLTDNLIEHTGIVDDVLCLGVGAHFMIWNPDEAIARIDKNDVIKKFVASQRAARKPKA